MFWWTLQIGVQNAWEWFWTESHFRTEFGDRFGISDWKEVFSVGSKSVGSLKTHTIVGNCCRADSPISRTFNCKRIWLISIESETLIPSTSWRLDTSEVYSLCRSTLESQIWLSDTLTEKFSERTRVPREMHWLNFIHLSFTNARWYRGGKIWSWDSDTLYPTHTMCHSFMVCCTYPKCSQMDALT